MIVLDTNVLGEFLAGDDDVVRFVRAQDPVELGVSTISVFELLMGIVHGDFGVSETDVHMTIATSNLTVLDFGMSEARGAARLRGDLLSAGARAGPRDCLIAGTAISNDSKLLTADRYFEDGPITDDLDTIIYREDEDVDPI